MNEKSEEVIFLVPRYHTNLEPIVQGFIDNGHEVQIFPWRRSIAEIRKVDKKLTFGDEAITRVLKLGFTQKYIYRIFNMLKVLINLKKSSKSVRMFVRCETSFFGVVSLLLIVASGMRKNSTIYTQYPIIHPKTHQLVWIYLVKNLLKFKYFSQVFVNPDKSNLIVRNIEVYKDWIDSELKFHSQYIPFAVPQLEELRNFKTGKIISVGKAENRKGLIEVVDVCRELWTEGSLNKTLDLIIQVHNDSQKQYLRKLEGITSDLVARGLVNICINLDTMETRAKIDASDFLILNSYEEPASFVQFEALALKVPFILNRSNGSSYLFPNGLGVKKIDSRIELKLGILELEEYLHMHIDDIDKVQAFLGVELSGAEIAKRWLKA